MSLTGRFKVWEVYGWESGCCKWDHRRRPKSSKPAIIPTRSKCWTWYCHNWGWGEVNGGLYGDTKRLQKVREVREKRMACSNIYTYIVGKGSLRTIECIWHTFIVLCLAVLTCVLYVCTYIQTMHCIQWTVTAYTYTCICLYHDMVPYTCSVSVAHPDDSVDVQLLTLITVSIAALATWGCWAAVVYIGDGAKGNGI